MDKLRRSGIDRVPRAFGAGMALLLLAGLAAATTVTVPVRVTFVNPVAISKVSALQFGSIDQNRADSASVTVAPDSAVTGLQAAASLTVTAAPGYIITIHVDSAGSGAGYSLTDIRCSYNAGSQGACDGLGYSETSVTSARLLVGATLTGDGTVVAGVADGSLDVTIIYQ